MSADTSNSNIRFTVGALRLAVGKLTAGRRVQPTLIKVLADMIGDDSQRLALALMLEAILGWSRRMQGAWWYKTRQDWFEECGIKRTALDRQSLLKAVGVEICLKPRQVGWSSVYHYRLNEAVFLARFAEALGVDMFRLAAVLREVMQPESVDATPEPLRRAWQDVEHEWPKWEPNLDGRRNQQDEVSKSALRGAGFGRTESSESKDSASIEESDNYNRAGAHEAAAALGSGDDDEPVVVLTADEQLWRMAANQFGLQAGVQRWVVDQLRLEKRDGAVFEVSVESVGTLRLLAKHGRLLDRLVSDVAGAECTVKVGLRAAAVPAFVALAQEWQGLYESDAAGEIAALVGLEREAIAALISEFGAAEVKRAARALQMRAPGQVKNRLAYLRGTLANFEQAS